MNCFKRLCLFSLLCVAPAGCVAQMQVSGALIAGAAAELHISGSGSTTLYLYGPAGAAKREAHRGTIPLSGDDLRAAGRYTAIVDGTTLSFLISPAKVDKLAFIARPSRVPAASMGAVLGSVFLFDRYQDLVLAPTPVEFRLSVAGSPAEQRSLLSKDGVASTQLNSGRRSGPAQFIAESNGVSVRRIVQQVASDPCSLHMTASPAADGKILVQTAPIDDCAGNAVPDGTIVTFTSVDPSGRSTVDARIKRGFAMAELPASKAATLSVAAGVVLGNEIRWGGGQ